MASPGDPAVRPRRVTSVALLDNTTNLSYVTAKLLRGAGIAADFVQERGAPFNQQPVWEDEDLVETTEEGTPPPRAGYWTAREAALGWRRPPWVVRPDVGPRAFARLPEIAARVARAVPPRLLPFGLAVAAKELAVIAAAARHDAVVTLGPAAVQAYLAGRPFTVIVTGWDVRELPFLTEARSPFLRARAWLQRAALGRAGALLVQPASDLPHLRRLGLAERARPFNIPVDLSAYAAITPRSAAEVLGAEIARRIDGRTVFFAPARVHFAIKRNDLLLQGFAKIAGSASVHLVMLDWGPDIGAAKELVRSLGIADHVSFLPYVMSKVRLVRAMRLADVICDQFLYTAYGSLTREALACGRPLVSSYDPTALQPHAPDDPAPITAARTPDEIAAACRSLLDPGVRAHLGEAARAWTARQNAAALADLREFIARAA